MDIDPGELRYRAIIERNVATATDAAGQPLEDWRAVGSARAAVRQLSGQKLLAAQGIHAEARVELVVRWIGDLRESDRIFLPHLNQRLWPVEIDRSDVLRLSMRIICRSAVMAGCA